MRQTIKTISERPFRVYLYNVILSAWNASATFYTTDEAMAYAREQMTVCTGRITRAKVIRTSDFFTMDTLEA